MNHHSPLGVSWAPPGDASMDNIAAKVSGIQRATGIYQLFATEIAKAVIDNVQCPTEMTDHHSLQFFAGNDNGLAAIGLALPLDPETVLDGILDASLARAIGSAFHLLTGAADR